MNWIKPSKIDGTVASPSSKSVMIRATAAALLADGVSEIARPSFCEDTLAALNVAAGLGAEIDRTEERVEIKGPLAPTENVLDCGESGLCLRMFAPIAALEGQETVLSARGSLRTRPVGMMEAPLAALGVSVQTNAGFPPLTVKGPLHGGRVVVDGSTTSQFLTGLLMALPICRDDSRLFVLDLRSRPYVAMTISVLERFGISMTWDTERDVFEIRGRQRFAPGRYEIEGDWSGAAFLLVAGALAGRVTVMNLRADSCQADVRVLAALRDAGASVAVAGDAVTVEADGLEAFEFDATDCPDLFPPLAALACFCEGRSVLRGAERLRHKESDRATALVEEFSRAGGTLGLEGNVMWIEGGPLEGGVIDARGDHRLAMAGAVAGLRAERGIRIVGPEVVGKSYPGFFRDLAALGGDIS